MKQLPVQYQKQFVGGPMLLQLALQLERWRLAERWPDIYRMAQQRMIHLYGKSEQQLLAYLFLAQIMLLTILIFCFFSLLFLVFQDPYLLWMAVLFAVLAVWLSIRECDRKIKQKRQLIRLELPIVINRMVLLLQAGETVQQVLMRIVKDRQKKKDHPLYAGLSNVSRKLENRVSFVHVLEDWNQDTGIQEVSLLVHTVLLHYRRGGADLTRSLKALSDQLWDRRIHTAKSLGEEASAKLIFPMVLTFFVVMMVVASPILFFMK